MTEHAQPDQAEELAEEPTQTPTRQALVLQTIIPDFAPVPRLCDRSNGWKPQVQRDFIEALAETGSVRSACRAVGRADFGAYKLRRHPDADEFRRAWDAALDIGMRRIEDVAMDRAINGHQQPVYSYGKLLGERTVYNDRLLMFMLRNRAPDRFGGALRQGGNGFGGASGPNAIDKLQRDRLKKRWRKEWEAEQTKEVEQDHRAICDSIDTKLDGMRQKWLQSMSPRVRALYRAYQEAERDEAQGRHPEPLPLLPGLPWPEHPRGEMDEAEWEELIELEERGITPIPPQFTPPAHPDEERPAPPPGRMIQLRDDGWHEPGRGIPNDGRAKPWP